MLPREHGAWAMLTAPYIAGAAIADGLGGEVLMGLAGILLLYLSRAPLIMVVKPRLLDGSFQSGTNVYASWFALFAGSGLAVFAWLWLAAGYGGLPWLGLGALAMFILHSTFLLRRAERSAAGEFTGIILLSSTAVLGGYLQLSDIDGRSLLIWFLSALYFGLSVYYVKMMLRSSSRRYRPAPGTRLSRNTRLVLARKTVAYMVGAALVLAVLAAVRVIPLGVIAAYVPAMAWISWNIARLGGRVRISNEGIAQTLLTLLFVIVLVAAYRSEM